MRIYDYLFYKINQFLEGFDDTPYFATVIVLCWLFYFNAITIVGIILQNREPEELERISNYFTTTNAVIAGILQIALHFLYYYYRHRFLVIMERYRSENRTQSILGTIFTLIYVALTIGIFFKYTVPNIGGILSVSS